MAYCLNSGISKNCLAFSDNIKPTHLTAKRELISAALSRAKEQLTLIGNRDDLLNDSYFSTEKTEVFQRMLNKAHILTCE